MAETIPTGRTGQTTFDDQIHLTLRKIITELGTSLQGQITKDISVVEGDLVRFLGSCANETALVNQDAATLSRKFNTSLQTLQEQARTAGATMDSGVQQATQQTRSRAGTAMADASKATFLGI